MRRKRNPEKEEVDDDIELPKELKKKKDGKSSSQEKEKEGEISIWRCVCIANKKVYANGWVPMVQFIFAIKTFAMLFRFVTCRSAP